jgi:hypothetical protein
MPGYNIGLEQRGFINPKRPSSFEKGGGLLDKSWRALWEKPGGFLFRG